MAAVDLAVPFAAASVFTLGGYGIVRSKRHAEAVGGVLCIVFLLCAMLAVLALLARTAGPWDGGRPAGQISPVRSERGTGSTPPPPGRGRDVGPSSPDNQPGAGFTSPTRSAR